MKVKLIFAGLFFITIACNKTTVDPNFGKPGEVSLIFPFENSECNVGTDSTETESTVVFEWNKSKDAGEYNLVLKNLISGDSSTYTTTDVKYSARILRAFPFAWYVVAKSNINEKTTQSPIWKFYNAGVAIENYAPFPAEIIFPQMAELLNASSVITLSWTGSDVDNDIIGYDVYFGTATPPDIIQADLTESTLSNIAITANTIYYWKVITKDAYGNSSDSGIYQFKIK